MFILTLNPDLFTYESESITGYGDALNFIVYSVDRESDELINGTYNVHDGECTEEGRPLALCTATLVFARGLSACNNIIWLTVARVLVS